MSCIEEEVRLDMFAGSRSYSTPFNRALADWDVSSGYGLDVSIRRVF